MEFPTKFCNGYENLERSRGQSIRTDRKPGIDLLRKLNPSRLPEVKISFICQLIDNSLS